MTLRRLTRLIRSLPKKLGSDIPAARFGKRRGRSSDFGAHAVEVLENRIVLTSLQLDVGLSISADQPSADLVAQALEDGRVLQTTPDENRLIYVNDGDVQIVSLRVGALELTADSDDPGEGRVEDSTEPLVAASDHFGNSLFYVGSGQIRPTTAIADTTLVGESSFDQVLSRIDAGPGGRTDSWWFSNIVSSSDSPAAFDSEGTVAAEVVRDLSEPVPIAIATEPPDTQESLADQADDDSRGLMNPVQSVVSVNPVQSFVGPLPSAQVVSRAVINKSHETIKFDDFQVVLTLDDQLSESLTREDLSNLVSTVQTILVARTSGPVSKFRMVLRTTIPRHRASRFQKVIVAPVAAVQREAAPVVVRPTPQGSHQEQQPVVQPKQNRLPVAKSRERKSPNTHSSNARRWVASPTQQTSKRSISRGIADSRVKALVAGENTWRPTVDAEVRVHPAAISRSGEGDELLAAAIAAEASVVEDSLVRIRDTARPDYAVQVGSSGDDERTSSQIFDARLVMALAGETSPVEIERPFAPAIESQILRQLEFETAPRGPPISETVASDASDRASELRLQMLRHSQAPRSPSMVFAQ